MAFNWRKFPWTNLHDLNLDWIIQTVKTLENNLADAVGTFREMIDTAIGPVRTALATETENRKAGDAAIQTAIENEIKPQLATETENRTSGDAALQSEIDNVKTLLNIESIERKENDAAIRQNAIFNITANISDEFTGGNITLDSTVISQLKETLSRDRLVSLALKNFTVQSGIYETLYLLLDSYTSPPEANGEYDAYFYNVGKTLSATITTATGVLTYTKV